MSASLVLRSAAMPIRAAARSAFVNPKVIRTVGRFFGETVLFMYLADWLESDDDESVVQARVKVDMADRINRWLRYLDSLDIGFDSDASKLPFNRGTLRVRLQKLTEFLQKNPDRVVMAFDAALDHGLAAMVLPMFEGIEGVQDPDEADFNFLQKIKALRRNGDVADYLLSDRTPGGHEGETLSSLRSNLSLINEQRGYVNTIRRICACTEQEAISLHMAFANLDPEVAVLILNEG